MSTLELKKKLVSRILNTESPILLGEVSRLLEIENEDKEIIKLTEQQKSAILKSREDIKNGNFLTSEQANKEIDEWLKE